MFKKPEENGRQTEKYRSRKNEQMPKKGRGAAREPAGNNNSNNSDRDSRNNNSTSNTNKNKNNNNNNDKTRLINGL